MKVRTIKQNRAQAFGFSPMLAACFSDLSLAPGFSRVLAMRSVIETVLTVSPNGN